MVRATAAPRTCATCKPCAKRDLSKRLDRRAQTRDKERVPSPIVIFAVEEVARSAAFYRRVFEWSVLVTAPPYVELEISPALRLGLYERTAYAKNVGSAPPPASPGEVARAELYLSVRSLPATIAALEAAGARCLSPRQTRTWGDEAAYFADPDGNVLAVAITLA